MLNELQLVKLNYKYQLWSNKINYKYFSVSADWFEYTKNDLELNIYNSILQNYSFLKCDYGSKLLILRDMRTAIKILIKNVRKINEVSK